MALTTQALRPQTCLSGNSGGRQTHERNKNPMPTRLCRPRSDHANASHVPGFNNSLNRTIRSNRMTSNPLPIQRTRHHNDWFQRTLCRGGENMDSVYSLGLIVRWDLPGLRRSSGDGGTLGGSLATFSSSSRGRCSSLLAGDPGLDASPVWAACCDPLCESGSDALPWLPIFPILDAGLSEDLDPLRLRVCRTMVELFFLWPEITTLSQSRWCGHY